MHYTPKKTVEQIIASGNDYLIAVKANQLKLFDEIAHRFEQAPVLSVQSEDEKARDQAVFLGEASPGKHARQTERTVTVIDTVGGIDPEWVGVQRFIRVQRSGTRANKPYEETVFYISSLCLDAAGFAQRIRAHWHIENRLHWPKDVVLKEDTSPLCDGYAPVNFSIVRTIAMNVFRQHGFASITKGIRQLAHDVRRLFFFFQ
jgi:predicted transposase YbfD/YdcC